MANTEIASVNSPFVNSHGKSPFTAYGRVALDAGGTTEVVAVEGAAVGDIVILSLEDDDGVFTIVHLDGKITAADELTINHTDDGTSTDGGYCSYIIIRP